MTPPNGKTTGISLPPSPDFSRDPAADTRRNRRVENALVRRACGYKVSLKKTFKVKRVEYDPDTGKKVAEVETLVPGTDEVHVPADLRASAYWLNNRDPLHWMEDPSGEVASAADRVAEEEEAGMAGGVVEIAAVAPPDTAPDGEGT